jgi:hypothetical protein
MMSESCSDSAQARNWREHDSASNFKSVISNLKWPAGGTGNATGYAGHLRHRHPSAPFVTPASLSGKPSSP